jgi:hypothetical protein
MTSSLDAIFRQQIRWQKRITPRGFTFLLGAGASADAGVPTSEGILRRLTTSRLQSSQKQLLERLVTIRMPTNIEDLVMALDTLSHPERADLYAFVKSWRLPVNSTHQQKTALALKKRILDYLFRWLKPTSRMLKK